MTIMNRDEESMRSGAATAPKGIVSFSPGLRGTSCPGCTWEKHFYRKAVTASVSTNGRNRVAVVWGGDLATQGSAQRATLGYEPESRWDSRNKSPNRLLLVLFLLCALSGLAAGGDIRNADQDYDAPAPGTYALPVIKAAADGALLDSKGQPVRLADLTRGRITVMSFIYTRCAAARACPMATGVLMQLHRESAKDADLAKQLRLVSISFDPVNDTPERMAAFSQLASSRPNAASWHFVTTRSQAELQPILDAYDQAVDKKQNPKDPTGPLNHTLRVFLVDAAGKIRNIYSSGTLDPRLVLADIRTLMLEKPPGRQTPLSFNHQPRDLR